MWLAKQQQRQLMLQPSHHLPLYSAFRRLHLTSLRFFPAPAASRRPTSTAKRAHFMVDYLVSSCGLSMAEAVKASGYLVHLRSPHKPDAVLRLLRREGLGDTHIRLVVLRRPDVLLSDAEKTLQPKIALLRGAGFSGSELVQLISICPHAFKLRNALPRLQFWENLVGDKQNLLKALDNYPQLLTYSLDERTIPTLSLLRSMGVSDDKIRAILLKKKALFILRSADKIRVLVEQVRSLGIPPGTRAFAEALCIFTKLSRSTLDAKSKLLSSFGWSQTDLTTAIRGFPNMFSISQKKIQKVMNFLLNDAGCKPSYVASRPVLLGYSMERRVIPRFRVLRSLKVKGLPGGDGDLYAAMILPEKKFVDKYISPNREECPELLEAYLAASSKSSSS